MQRLLRRYLHDESGQDLIEYGLLIGIITTAAIAAVGTMGEWVVTAYSNLSAALP